MFSEEKHDGARAFDERGAATYMQQILGAMSCLAMDGSPTNSVGRSPKDVGKS